MGFICKNTPLYQSYVLILQAPAIHAVEWELHEYVNNDNTHGPFSGPPRDEVDRNWHNIINGKHIR
jgi:hypothetical protein